MINKRRALNRRYQRELMIIRQLNTTIINIREGVNHLAKNQVGISDKLDVVKEGVRKIKKGVNISYQPILDYPTELDTNKVVELIIKEIVANDMEVIKQIPKDEDFTVSGFGFMPKEVGIYYNKDETLFQYDGEEMKLVSDKAKLVSELDLKQIRRLLMK